MWWLLIPAVVVVGAMVYDELADYGDSGWSRDDFPFPPPGEIPDDFVLNPRTGRWEKGQ